MTDTPNRTPVLTLAQARQTLSNARNALCAAITAYSELVDALGVTERRPRDVRAVAQMLTTMRLTELLEASADDCDRLAVALRDRAAAAQPDELDLREEALDHQAYSLAVRFMTETLLGRHADVVLTLPPARKTLSALTCRNALTIALDRFELWRAADVDQHRDELAQELAPYLDAMSDALALIGRLLA